MKKILVVEDEVVIAMGLCLLLESEGFEVQHASDGQAGLEAAEKRHFDLIISDCMMPRMDGPAMIRALRAAGITTPVIFCTSVDEDRLDQLEEGEYEAYLMKPFEDEQLLATIREILDK